MTELVGSWSFEQRLRSTFEKTLPKLGPEARAQLVALVDPTSLSIITGVLVAWVASHAFGFGEVIDIVILVVGAAAMGFTVFEGLDHLYAFASGVYSAKTERDLDLAADNLAKAIGILGIQVVLAVLFRGAKSPRPSKGGKLPVGSGPRNGSFRYRPTIKGDPSVPAGTGSTTRWGDITVSTRGTATDRAVVLLHEKVHQFLSPKLYILREYRASNRQSSYVRSSLYRYIEEALAETIAQVGVNGIKSAFVGLRFPVQRGYLYLRMAGAPHPAVSGLYLGYGFIPEGASLVYTGLVQGIAFELLFEAGMCPAPSADQ